MFLNGTLHSLRVPPIFTDEERVKADWGMNMSLVDEINNCKQPIVIKEVVRTLRKKLASKSLGVVMLAL
eukprot:3799-Heterococcus_DN1.PRE.2